MNKIEKDYVAGMYVGKIISLKYLKYMEIDFPREHDNVILLEKEDLEEYNRVNKLAVNHKNWNEYAKVRNRLKNKYLPKIIEVELHEFPVFPFDDYELFLKGIDDYLHETDGSNYQVHRVYLNLDSNTLIILLILTPDIPIR